MSDTIANHGYVPEEHAPDPVTSHGDPTPPGKIAIWLFLASEIMFFIGVLGSYIVLRSGAPGLFSKHAAILSKSLAGVNTLVLILSSVTMYIAVDAAHKNNRPRLLAALGATILCAFGFMGIKYVEYTDKFHHATIVGHDGAGGPIFVYDGHVHGDQIKGYRAEASKIEGFNINLVAESDVHHASAEAAGISKERADEHPPQEFPLPKVISQKITYGPWKNIFYASYFTTTGVHGAHVVGGIVALLILLVFALSGKVLPAHTEYVGLYWHFVDLVWIFLFPLLYLI